LREKYIMPEAGRNSRISCAGEKEIPRCNAISGEK